MAEWIGNLFLTAGSGITLTKPDTQGHGGTTISANAGTGPSVWSSAPAYVTGDLVIDRNGFWKAAGPNTNSEPVSGSTSWDLVAGTPSIDTLITPAQMRVAPFYDPGSTGPGVIAIPAPGANKMVFPVNLEIIPSAGSVWGSDPQPLATWNAPSNPAAAQTVNLYGGSDFAPLSPTFWFDLRNMMTLTAGQYFEPGAPTPNVVVNQPWVIWATIDAGLVTVGTISIRYRFFYTITDVS